MTDPTVKSVIYALRTADPSNESETARLLKIAAETLEAETERADDADQSLNSWFTNRALAASRINDEVMGRLRGYLRTSRSGGMEPELSVSVEAVVGDMVNRDIFADLFARLALDLPGNPPNLPERLLEQAESTGGWTEEAIEKLKKAQVERLARLICRGAGLNPNAPIIEGTPVKFMGWTWTKFVHLAETALAEAAPASTQKEKPATDASPDAVADPVIQP